MERPAILASTKREVRRRCGFGCVLCGCPLYHYHHEPPFEEVHRHDPERIFLLCAAHHDERTRGLVPPEQVIDAGRNPWNLRRGGSSPYRLHFAGDECSANLGGTLFTASLRGHGTFLRPLVIDGEAPLSFTKDGDDLLISLTLHDESGAQLLTIVNNELVYSLDAWDIRWKGRRLSIRARQGQYVAELRFDPPNRVNVGRGRFLARGVQVLVHRDRLVIANRSRSGMTVSGGRYQLQGDRVGLSIGDATAGTRCAVRYPVPDRGDFDASVVDRWLRGA